MTGEQFVKLCYEEKEAILKNYFEDGCKTAVSEKIQRLVKKGTDKAELYDIINSILNENYYTLMLALDGEASLGDSQMTYKVYDENGNLLNDCGEIEAAAFRFFMEN